MQIGNEGLLSQEEHKYGKHFKRTYKRETNDTTALLLKKNNKATEKFYGRYYFL